MHIYIHREKDVNKHWPNWGGSHRNIDSVWNESKSFFPYHRKDWTNNIHITFLLNERRFSFIVIYSHLFVIVHFFPSTIKTYHHHRSFGTVTYLHMLRVRTSILRSLHCIAQPALDWPLAQLKQIRHAIACRTNRVSIMIATLILDEWSRQSKS